MLRTEGISAIFQVYYSEDIGGFEMEIVGVNGRFNAEGMYSLLLRSTRHRYTDIENALEKIDNTSWDVEVEVKYAEPETQYGTGEGDVLRLPGYYYIGKVLSIVQHEPMNTDFE